MHFIGRTGIGIDCQDWAGANIYVLTSNDSRATICLWVEPRIVTDDKYWRTHYNGKQMVDVRRGLLTR